LRRALELDPRLAESTVDKHGFYNDPEEFERQLRVLPSARSGDSSPFDASHVSSPRT